MLVQQFNHFLVEKLLFGVILLILNGDWLITSNWLWVYFHFYGLDLKTGFLWGEYSFSVRALKGMFLEILPALKLRWSKLDSVRSPEDMRDIKIEADFPKYLFGLWEVVFHEFDMFRKWNKNMFMEFKFIIEQIFIKSLKQINLMNDFI